MTTPPRRSRRTQAEAKQAILDAARALFAERGYANTTTRAIAQEADASEVLLYRYFNSKAELFEQAISAPFDDMMQSARTLMIRTDAPEYIREYVRRLYKMLSEDRRLILALITTRAYEDSPELSDDKPRGLRRYFEQAEEGVARFYDDAGIETEMSPAIASRLAFASVVSAAMLGDWLFDDVADQKEIVEGVAEFVMRAVYGAPAAESSNRSKARSKRRRALLEDARRRRRR